MNFETCCGNRAFFERSEATNPTLPGQQIDVIAIDVIVHIHIYKYTPSSSSSLYIWNQGSIVT